MDLATLQQRVVACRRCPRLAQYLDGIRRDHPDWHCKPVPSFGDPAARILIIGLAPGRAGSNRTGRMFTGDGSRAAARSSGSTRLWLRAAPFSRIFLAC